MDHLFETRFSELLVTYGEKIALAIICLIVGKIVINLIIGAVGRVKYFNNVDQTAKGYINSFLKIGLCGIGGVFRSTRTGNVSGL